MNMSLLKDKFAAFNTGSASGRLTCYPETLYYNPNMELDVYFQPHPNQKHTILTATFI